MNVIFVAGIHAVGKSTVCKEISDEFGVPHYTASQIIRDEKSSAVSENSKLVADVADNQRLLIQGVSRLLEKGHLLLDGHFTMRRKSDGEIEHVHLVVFRELQLSGVVLFTDHPEKISKRLYKRDEKLQPVKLIKDHQDTEITHAQHVATTLGLPIVILSAFDTKGMGEALTSWGLIPEQLS